MRALAAAASFLIAGLLTGEARAHSLNLSQSQFVVAPSGVVRATLVFARADADRLLPVPPNGITARADAQSCPAGAVEIRAVEADAVEISLDFACPMRWRALRFAVPLLSRLPPAHRQAARVTTSTGSIDGLLTSSSALEYALPALEVGSPQPRATELRIPGPSASSSFVAAVKLGIEHILTGWDHLLFLFALLLGLRGAGQLATAISAFTLAHSVTLALAALAVPASDARLVEPAIAASIAWVAFENVRASPPAHRWPVTFLFGLVHGFGFAAALKGLALSRERLVPTLLGFNVGIELGQALVVVLALPVWSLASRGNLGAGRLRRMASLLVGTAGVMACVVRLVTP